MSNSSREKFLILGIFIAFGLILSRLFYWQIIKGAQLQAVAEDQYHRTITKQGSRGTISTADGYALVTNREVYRLFAEPKIVSDPSGTAAKLAPILLEVQLESTSSATSAETTQMLSEIQNSLEQKLSKDSQWVSLYTGIENPVRERIADMKLQGIGFDAYDVRSYPEASMAAHITGFVGKNDAGEDIGYFGLEGALEKELQARSSTETVFTDALGFQLSGDPKSAKPIDGRDVTTTIRRDIQYVVMEYLEEGIEQYGAKSGEIIVMEPQTGKILALAALPQYDQATFYDYEASLYKNPSLANVYEPGSTFKVLTVAAGIDTGAVSPDTICTKCSEPRKFGKYTIRTWNDVYNPNISIEQGLAKSDNTAMIFVAELMGADIFKEYLKSFGIGKALGVELQEDIPTPFPDRLGPVELATTSFGQGISTNSLQLTKAIASIANGGKLMKPMIVEKVEDPLTGEVIETPVKVEEQVISPETASKVTKMMITAAESGEAQWISSKTHTIAGKTGTSQVAVGGEYSADKTIASFIGFAPPENPKFIMLVKLDEPQSSPWAAETAAPLWYKIADKLYLLLNIPPDR